jgi:hypothetical protein
MIQFKRGKTGNWRMARKPLAAGQPGYDKDKHKIKIGDGEALWNNLPYASGLSAEEILSSEKEAQKRFDPLDLFSKTIITYGSEAPNKTTIGQLYLQHYDTEPETDYIVSYGVDGIWTYQKWKSGIAKCWGTLSVTTAVNIPFENTILYMDNKVMKKISYPIKFKKLPTETATIQSSGGIVWLAGREANSESNTAAYTIISPDKLESAKYTICLGVEGCWR